MVKRPAVLYLTVASILFGSALLQGHWTDRWTDTFDPEAVTKALHRLPDEFGDWKAEPEQVAEMDKVLSTMMKGPYLLRHYVNQLNGASVILFLTADHHGPLLVNHTPDGCYRDHGYTQEGEVEKHSVPLKSASPAEFLVARFSKGNVPAQSQVRVFWSWSGAGQWEVPQHPRLKFARYRVLYKLTVVHTLQRTTASLEEDPGFAFIQAVVPALEKSLFTGS
jgi:hypothetical protein